MSPSPNSHGYDSVPPPSSRIPGRTPHHAPYVIGIVAMAAGMVALIWYFKCSPSAETGAATSSRAALPPPPNVMDQALPPPPEKSAEPDASAAPSASVAASVVASAASSQPVGASGEGACVKCGEGHSNTALNAAVKAQAGLARGCYKRALQHDAPTGNLTIAVAVGPSGQVCSASIVSDTIRSQEVSSCVLQKLRSGTYPRPTSGCVVLQVPIAFATK